MSAYSTQKAVAFRLTYGPKWRMGERPERVKCGNLLFGADDCLEDAEAALRRAFPKAKALRLYDCAGELYCLGSFN